MHGRLYKLNILCDCFSGTDFSSDLKRLLHIWNSTSTDFIFPEKDGFSCSSSHSYHKMCPRILVRNGKAARNTNLKWRRLSDSSFASSFIWKLTCPSAEPLLVIVAFLGFTSASPLLNRMCASKQCPPSWIAVLRCPSAFWSIDFSSGPIVILSNAYSKWLRSTISWRCRTARIAARIC